MARAFNKDFLSDRDAEAREASPRVLEWYNSVRGCSFGDGLYRIHTAASAKTANDMVRKAFFSGAHGSFACFGFDWLGRQFALDLRHGRQAPDPDVLMFIPASNEQVETHTPFTQFHDRFGLKSEAGIALATPVSDFLKTSLWLEWRAAGGAALGFNECVEFTVPLFLGGAEEPNNMKVTDIELYWAMAASMWVPRSWRRSHDRTDHGRASTTPEGLDQ